MAASNLRIIYDNAIDTATLSASSTAGATSVNNLKKDQKSLIWRSSSSSSNNVKVYIVATFTTAKILSGVILPYCNLTAAANIRIRGYTGAAPTLGGTVDAPTFSATGTQVFDTGAVLACPYVPLGMWEWGTQPLGVNAYTYGGGTYGRVWLGDYYTVSSILIEITDVNSNNYIELSKIVAGAHWSPKFNTKYGLSSAMQDLSSSARTEAGDLVTARGPKFSKLSFDLEWLTPSDRLEFTKILKNNGVGKPLFISLFPNNSIDWGKEQSHQLYGKLSQLSPITHPIVDMYSTQIELEEV